MESPQSPSKSTMHRAAFGLNLVAALQIAHILLAIGVAPEEKRTNGVVISGILLNVIVASLLVYVASGVVHCKRIPGAVCLVWFLLIGALAAGTVAIGMGYKGGYWLLCFQILFLAVLFWSAIVVTKLAIQCNFGITNADKSRE